MVEAHGNNPRQEMDSFSSRPQPEDAGGRAVKLSDRPVFVVGSPRSGTTIMCQMIDAHPHLLAPYWETGLFVRFHELLTNHIAWIWKEHRASFPLDRPDLIDWIRRSVETLFAKLAATCGKSRWAEKTPAHVFHMDLIHEVFPNVQFIHMIRNGRDVVRSLQNVPWAPRKIRWSIDRWIDSVRAGRRYGRELPKEQYMEIRYEQLLADQENTLRALCKFLGEPFAEQMLAFHQPANNSWNYSFRPLRNAPINRYKPLKFLQRLLFRQRASDLMRELNYR